ncbi:hypothetical protein AnigIFM63604_004387 [Aspergillus niger]|uniref:Uncharacterized protein n=1 Tax=Aspergillus niger TaxID=5061 RepID=A0A9W6ADR5_ASPNG|nr:hypothetical protein AnigIFM63604_004387 [Aspergillus niger]
MIRSEFESVAMDATIRSAIEDAILSPSTRENENAKLRNTRRRWFLGLIRYTCKKSGMDQDDGFREGQSDSIRVPPNCEFCIDDLDQPDWYYPFRNSDFIHVGGLGGDRQLLTCILQGAYRYGLTPRIAHANTVSRCCSPNGMLKIWDSNVHFQDPQGETGLHRLYNDMNKAFRMDGRSLDLPLQYLSEMESHGFINVAEHVYRIPLNTEQPMIQNSVVISWADGFEAYSMDLLC